MFLNRTSWTVISYSHFHGNQFTLSFTHSEANSVISPQCLDNFGRGSILFTLVIELLLDIFEYWLTTISFVYSIVQLTIRKELEFQIASVIKI